MEMLTFKIGDLDLEIGRYLDMEVCGSQISFPN